MPWAYVTCSQQSFRRGFIVRKRGYHWMKLEQGPNVLSFESWKDVLTCKDTRPYFEGYERTSNRFKTTPAAVRYMTWRLLSSDISLDDYS
jgi:hypothetical protein